MRRQLVAVLAIGLVVGALAPAQAAKKKKPKPKPPAPVAVDVVYHVVWNGDACALSTTKELATEGEYCSDPFAGAPAATGLNTGPFVASAIDGVPLTLDAAKPIRGKIEMDSFILDDAAPIPMGVGQAEVQIILTATSAGAELTLGETTAEYLVTPQTTDYEIEFEIVPAADLAGKVLDSITFSAEVVGNSAFHGSIPADGTSTLSFGAYALAK